MTAVLSYIGLQKLPIYHVHVSVYYSIFVKAQGGFVAWNRFKTYPLFQTLLHIYSNDHIHLKLVVYIQHEKMSSETIQKNYMLMKNIYLKE